MLRIGVVFFVLAVILAGAGAAARPSGGHPRAAHHSCGLRDRQFLDVYATQLTEVGMYGNDFVNGDAAASEVIDAANAAATAVRETSPADSALVTVRKYAPAMFQAYAQAVHVRASGKPARKAMVAAYSIGARIQQVLQEARPGLTATGCSLQDVL